MKWLSAFYERKKKKLWTYIRENIINSGKKKSQN